jgi:hypothetical protein
VDASAADRRQFELVTDINSESAAEFVVVRSHLPN